MARITWTPERTAEVVALLRSLEKDTHARQLPPEVYEALLRLHKKVSVELVLFDKEGRVWLTRRPTREENPAEPFPGEWNGPGATLTATESLVDALERLVKEEIGDVQITPPHLVGHEDIPEPHRGSYLAFIYVSRIVGGAITTRRPSGWYHSIGLPGPIVAHHQSVIIPAARRAAALLWHL